MMDAMVLVKPGASEWLDMAARASSSSEVLLGLTGLAWSCTDIKSQVCSLTSFISTILTLDHQSVLASRRPQSQLVKGDDFTY